MTHNKTLSILHRQFIASTVRSLSPAPAKSLSVDSSVEDAIVTLKDNKIGSVIVVDSAKIPVGIFTERDAVNEVIMGRVDPSQVFLKSVAQGKLFTIQQSASIARLLYLMTLEKIRHVPVIGPTPESLGIISVRDIVRFIYLKLTKKLTNFEAIVLDPTLKVDSFFESNISLLTPEKPITISRDSSIKQGLIELVKHHIGSIVVTERDGSICGIFTERDYIKKVALKSLDLNLLRISTVMTPKPATAQTSMSIAYALNLMFEGNYRHLPVVDFNENLCGILSIKNFLEYVTRGIVTDLEKEQGKK